MKNPGFTRAEKDRRVRRDVEKDRTWRTTVTRNEVHGAKKEVGGRARASTQGLLAV